MIALVEDNKIDQEIIISALEKSYLKYNLIKEKIHLYNSAEEFLESEAENDFKDFSLIILDIYMEQMNGTQLAQKIREKNKNVHLVFCSSSNDFACESYQVNAGYYITKPIDEQEVSNMVFKLIYTDAESAKYVMLPNGIKILFKHIKYSEYSNHAIYIHCTNGNIIKAWMKQIDFCNLISESSSLCPCNKGMIVNFNHIEYIEKNNILMTDGTTIPISRSRIKDVKNLYSDFLINKIKTEM